MMQTNARSSLRLFGFAGTLALISAPAVTAALPIGAAPMTRAAPQTPRRAPKHCCLVVATVSTSSGTVQVFHNAPPYNQIGSVKYPTQNPAPAAAVVSTSGIVYVADLNSATVYAFGNGYRKAPTASYVQSNPSGTAIPRALAVGDDGTLYVADALYSSGTFTRDVVQVYPSGSSQPFTLQGPPNAVNLGGVAVDPNNTVYIAAEAKLPSDPSQKVVQVIQYAGGSPSGQIRNLSIPPHFGKAMAADAAGNLLIGDTNGSCGAAYVIPPGQTTPSHIIGTACSSGAQVSGLALTARHTLYLANSSGLQVQEYTYPRGKPLGVLFIQNAAEVIGIGEGPARQ